jgi:hypothetical protein
MVMMMSRDVVMMQSRGCLWVLCCRVGVASGLERCRSRVWG